MDLRFKKEEQPTMAEFNKRFGPLSEAALVKKTTYALADIPEGEIISIKEGGKDVAFLVAKHDYEPELNGTGRTLIVRLNVLDERVVWNTPVLNTYATSTVDQFLNNDYRNLFDESTKEKIGNTKFRYTIGGGDSTLSTLERPIFLLSLAELGTSHENSNVEGSALPVADTIKEYFTTAGTGTWSRTPQTTGAGIVFFVRNGGTVDYNSSAGNYSVMPAFTLPSDFIIRAETQVELTDLDGNPIPGFYNPYLWDGPKKLGSLQPGDLIKLNEDGAPKQFIVLDLDHYGPGTGVTVIRKDCFSEIAWNPGGSSSGQYMNRYFASAMDNFCDGIYPLKLDPKIRECIVPVPIVVAEGNSVDTLHTIYRKAFALSCTEVGATGWKTEGTKFDYFDTAASKKAYLEGTTTAVNWGLRSSMSGGVDVYYIASVVAVGFNRSYATYFAPRPAFNLNPNMVITEQPDSDGCYNLLAKE